MYHTHLSPMIQCASNPSGTIHPPNPLQTCYTERSSEDETLTASQRMEKQFFIHFITLINEVQGKQKLPSQIVASRKSAWVKQVQNPKQKKDALTLV